MFLLKDHTTVKPVRLEPAAPQQDHLRYIIFKPAK